jgi:hypothetical protein
MNLDHNINPFNRCSTTCMGSRLVGGYGSFFDPIVHGRAFHQGRRTRDRLTIRGAAGGGGAWAQLRTTCRRRHAHQPSHRSPVRRSATVTGAKLAARTGTTRGTLALGRSAGLCLSRTSGMIPVILWCAGRAAHCRCTVGRLRYVRDGFMVCV